MKKSKGFLLILLVLPLALVLFLHRFGENKFEIPVFHSEPTPMARNCGHSDFPYRVSSRQVELFRSGELSIWTFLPPPDNSELKAELLRLCEKIRGKPIRLVFVTSSEGTLHCGDSVSPDNKLTEDIKTCTLMMPTGSNAVLLDGKGRIRGYYRFLERDEVDRVAVETDILLNNEEHYP